MSNSNSKKTRRPPHQYGIDDFFDFGKYKGFTLREVYQGVNNIDKKDLWELLGEYLFDYFEFGGGCTINEPLIILNDFIEIFSKAKLNAGMKYAVINSTCINLRQDNSSKDINEIRKSITIGHPSYIEWCINNVQHFHLSPHDLAEIQTLEANKYLYLYLLQQMANNQRLINLHGPVAIPVLYKEKYFFLVETIEKNQQKFDFANPYYNSDDYSGNEKPSYGNYNGSYAQDMAGWSDQMIDDALGGEADAYWNIN